MFNFVHEKKRFVQIVLALIILPFAFFGMDSFNQSGDGESLATVGGKNISQQEFDQALRQQQDSIREAMGDAYDPAMLDNPERKRAILENLVDQNLLMSQGRAAGLTVNDNYLAQAIIGIKEFQTAEGKFDKKLFESVLRAQNRSPLAFEANVVEQLRMRQMTDSYLQNGYASRVVADNLVRLSEQQRVVAVAQIELEPFLTQAKVDESAVKSYYDMNRQEFQTDEQARVEYVTFSAEALQSQVGVDEAEIRKYYEEHQPEFGTQEQRQATHILISVTPQASNADQQAAKAKAEQVLQLVKQSPTKFADLARQYSQDPGSAANGGDLGMFGRGMMVKSFDESVFNLKVGEISGLVQSDFGYHIIKLLAVSSAKVSPLDEVRNTIAQKVKLQKANDKFAELAEKFSEMVYEQSDTLKPAAEMVKMPLQQSAWLNKKQIEAAPWTGKALQAVFTEDVLKNKRNSVAVEIAPNTLLAARLLEHKPASIRPLAEVGGSIRQKLLRQQALELAGKQGKMLLEQLQRGEQVNVEWKAPVTVTRVKHAGLNNDLSRQVFQVNASKFPAYTGVENPQGGYMLARLDEVKDITDIDSVSRVEFLQNMRQLTGDALYKAYLADAKKSLGVTMKDFAAIENK